MSDNTPQTPLAAEIQREVARRRTFAIISHPDAGKTTLTEKLLLYSGMVRTAGMVGGRKHNQNAASDWMSMEQERGISITASAMQFPYKDVVINILDTPGHQDFSEDTYRTLTAADSVIMVIDGAKGVETQTRKLFEACRLRGTPVFTFINKWDMPGRDPIDLMSEVEDILGIAASPLNWPIGSAKEFRGIVRVADRHTEFYEKLASGGAAIPKTTRMQLAEATSVLEPSRCEQIEEELLLLEEAGNSFHREAFLDAKITPVFFGSALTNFGVEPLFDAFVDLAPPPGPRTILRGEEPYELLPTATDFSAHVFKLQANMNPRHRDCVAFLRINSGKFTRDMQVTHERLQKKVRLARPHTLLVAERETLESAFPGDIIGVISPGNFAIGDTLSHDGGFAFEKLPQFQPEHFARLEAVDMKKRKSLDKGIEQLAGEGAVQLLWDWGQPEAFPFLAAVGKLQFEVMQYRLKDEYGVEIRLSPLPYQSSAWLEGQATTFEKGSRSRLVQDRFGRPMVLFTTPWEKNLAIKNNPDHRLLDYA
jgi:peptide chain release factor 3